MILVLATGGTIAGRGGAAGTTPADSGANLLAALPADPVLPDVPLGVRDVFAKDSSQLTPDDQVHLAGEVHRALADPAVTGVVVTHGTDTTEETAYLLELLHADDRPVVLTGAQRSADAPDADGPRNLRDAIAVAADPRARGLGVLVVFDGVVWPARGTRKTHTLRPAAFAQPDGGPVGRIADGRLVVESLPLRPPHLDLGRLDLTGVRVDIAAVYPGADAVALRAFADAGATGVVLQATGAGNANTEIAQAVADLTARGIVVALTTRVDTGPVAGIYGGGGGGVDLIAAGAVPLGTLRAGQGRILLLALLGILRDPAAVRAAIPSYVGGP